MFKNVICFIIIQLLSCSTATLIQTFQEQEESTVSGIFVDQLDQKSNGPANEATFLSNSTFGAIILLLLCIQATVLFKFGQPFITKTGQLKLWEGDIIASQNSQHLSDWYSFTHILHGFIFSGATAFLLPNASVKHLFLVSLGTEIVWEIAENSPIIIERYRQNAISQGYSGDTVVNSLSDTLAMTIGFVIAANVSFWIVFVLGIAEEIFVGYKIRDNLTLNIIQLIHPFESISNWQSKKGHQK